MVLQVNTLVREKYRITRLIGDGGMGAVYEAQHLILRVPVALKFLHTELAERPGLAERFLREARVSASIQSPHVTRVTDVDTTEAGTPFLVMELLRGESLQSVLDRERCLDESTSIDYTLQILSGLEAAHALNVVHRDLKPDNVFITQSQGGPVLKLIDFGIAKLRSSDEFKQTLTRAGSMMGTPEYMAPEQLYSAEDVDARADLFSLGVMLYEMLSGERPATGDDATQIVAQFVRGETVPLRERLPGVNPKLAQIVERALAAQREDRFASACEMRLALAPLATSLSHAGQLAATQAPLPVSGLPLPLAVDEPDPSTRRTSVADTLPPDETEPDKTEDDPVLPTAGQTEDAALPKLQAHAAAAVGPPAVAPGARTSRARSGKQRGLVAALITLGVMLAGAMLALVLFQRQPRVVPGLPPLDAPAPARTLEPLATADSLPGSPAPASPSPEPPSRPAPPVPRPPGPRPTGTAQPTADAGPPFAFPSSLPPLPSSLPPLPSGFPTALPSFFPPLPGFTPPPAAPTADAGP